MEEMDIKLSVSQDRVQECSSVKSKNRSLSQLYMGVGPWHTNQDTYEIERYSK